MRIKKLLLTFLVFICAEYDTHDKLEEICTIWANALDPVNQIPEHMWSRLIANGFLKLTIDESEKRPRLVVDPQLKLPLKRDPYLESLVDVAYFEFLRLKTQIKMNMAVNDPTLPKDSNLPKLCQEIENMKQTICAAQELIQALESIVLAKDEKTANTAMSYIKRGIYFNPYDIIRSLTHITSPESPF